MRLRREERVFTGAVGAPSLGAAAMADNQFARPAVGDLLLEVAVEELADALPWNVELGFVTQRGRSGSRRPRG